MWEGCSRLTVVIDTSSLSPPPFCAALRPLHRETCPPRPSPQLVRAGAEVSTLGRRDFFQFDYQGGMPMEPVVRHLQPGDTLITRCTYSSIGRNWTTRFGESTRVRGRGGGGLELCVYLRVHTCMHGGALLAASCWFGIFTHVHDKASSVPHAMAANLLAVGRPCATICSTSSVGQV